MKIAKSKLQKIISEETEAFLRERGWSPQMKAQAKVDAYRDYVSQDSEQEELERQKEKEFRKAHQAQLKSREGLPDWMTEADGDVPDDLLVAIDGLVAKYGKDSVASALGELDKLVSAEDMPADVPMPQDDVMEMEQPQSGPSDDDFLKDLMERIGSYLSSR